MCGDGNDVLNGGPDRDYLSGGSGYLHDWIGTLEPKPTRK